MNEMDNLTVGELERLYTMGMITVTGNGHVAAVVIEEKVDKVDQERSQHGC